MKTPQTVALGDQVHAEITDRANRAVISMAADGGLTLNEDQLVLTEIGAQAGLTEALRVVSERGWLVVPEPEGGLGTVIE